MADLPWGNVKKLDKTALLIRNLIFDQKFNKISTEDRKKVHPKLNNKPSTGEIVFYKDNTPN